jgi:ABC-2 type transport system ATP-binding protein
MMNNQNRDIVVETISLTKRYKDFWGRDKVKAVDDLNIQIYQGEVFGLLGPNGSGKTTTIKMLLGLLFPSGGKARIFGKSPQNVEVKSRIGYLPEETRLYQFLNSWETLDFYGRIFSLDRSERSRRSDALVDMIGLGPAAGRAVGQYSKGMARRIGLAQSLINDPDLLILDEPTSGLDPIGTRQIKDLLLELKKRGKTILLSSHLLADVEDVCDRVAIMYGGKLLCCGHIEELLSQQDLTQIQTSLLSDDQIKGLRNFVEDNLKGSVVSIGSPRDRLERFFLRMVQKAQEEHTTSGALTGGPVSNFLRRGSDSETGTALLDKLVSSEKPTKLEPAPAGGEKSETPSIQTQLLEELTTKKKEAAASDTHRLVQDRPPSPKKDQIDQSLLDRLTESSDEPRKKNNGG